MPDPSIVFLMYHELEIPGRTLCQPEPGYARYAVSEVEFRDQMQHLQQYAYQGLNVSQALGFAGREFAGKKPVAITFDDGSETDLLTAAPILLQAGFNATFYLTVGWLGSPGHLSVAQVKELSSEGFEIGCHSMTHAYLTDLDDLGRQREMFESKSKLEQMVGKPVAHFSCPGGRYNDRVAEVARAAGYRTIATSRIQANSSTTDSFALGRIAILRGLSITTFAEICSGEALPRLRAESGIRNAAKQLLGSSLYDRVRGVLLGRRN
jgi:peptidoglycan/xylan/chitin deacetylase (PgdA/CDA1 family)